MMLPLVHAAGCSRMVSYGRHLGKSFCSPHGTNEEIACRLPELRPWFKSPPFHFRTFIKELIPSCLHSCTYEMGTNGTSCHPEPMPGTLCSSVSASLHSCARTLVPPWGFITVLIQLCHWGTSGHSAKLSCFFCLLCLPGDPLWDSTSPCVPTVSQVCKTLAPTSLAGPLPLCRAQICLPVTPHFPRSQPQ